MTFTDANGNTKAFHTNEDRLMLVKVFAKMTGSRDTTLFRWVKEYASWLETLNL